MLNHGNDFFLKAECSLQFEVLVGGGDIKTVLFYPATDMSI